MPIDQCIRYLNCRGVLPELKNCRECDGNGRCGYFVNFEGPGQMQNEKQTWWVWFKRKTIFIQIVFAYAWRFVFRK